MRWSLCLSVMLLAAHVAAAQGGALHAPPAAPDTALDRELRRSAQAWMDAYNANDPAALAAFYAEDAQYLSPHVQGLIIRGRERSGRISRGGWPPGGTLTP